MKKNFKRMYWTIATVAMGLLPTSAFAEGETTGAVDVLGNLKTFMLSLLSAAGVIVVIWGIVQVAMGFKSQDGTQKTQGILFLAGGAIMASIGAVLTLLGL